MNSSRDRNADRILRTAAWLYVGPRAAIGILILATLGLAAFLTLFQLAIAKLHHLGA